MRLHNQKLFSFLSIKTLYSKMDYFRIAKFSGFCLKNMKIYITCFLFSRSFVSAKIITASYMSCVLGAAIKTLMNTQLLFYIPVHKQMVKLGKYFEDFNFRSFRLTAK